MKIFYLSESRQSFEYFLSLNDDIKEFSYHAKSVPQLLEILTDALVLTQEDFLFVQTPVVLPKNYLDDLRSAVAVLDVEWPNWAACGAEGFSLDRVGVNQDLHVSFSGSPLSLPTYSKVVLPAAQITSDLIVFRGNKFPLKQMATMNPHNVEEFFGQLGRFFAIQSNCLLLVPEVSYYKVRDGGGTADNWLSLLGGKDNIVAGIAQSKLHNPTLAIVTRTRFRNLHQLQRASVSSAAFRNSPLGANIKHYIISDSTPPKAFVKEQGCVLEEFPAVLGDSRFYLIRKIVERVDADFFLFLDDDDALLEKHAEEIVNTLSTYPRNSVFHFGSVYFLDAPNVTIEKVNSESPRKTVPSAFVKTAFLGVNQTPFSATIWPRALLKDTTEKAFEAITLLEDYFLLLTSWTSGFRPVFLDYNLSAISISGEGNVVNSGNEMDWIRARANLAAHLSRSNNWMPLFEQRIQSRKEVEGMKENPSLFRKLIRMKLFKSAIDQKIFLRILRRQITVKELIHKIKLVLEI